MPRANINAEMLQALKNSARATENLTAEIQKLDGFMQDQQKRVRDLTSASGGFRGAMSNAAQVAGTAWQYVAGSISRSSSDPSKAQETVQNQQKTTTQALPNDTRQSTQTPTEESSTSTPLGAATGAADEGASVPEKQGVNTSDVIALDLLGENAPGILRDVMNRRYGIERTARWGQGVAGSFNQTITNMSNSDRPTMQAMGNTLSAIGLPDLLKGTSGAIGKISNLSAPLAYGSMLADWAQSMTQRGYDFGYGPASGSPAILGSHFLGGLANIGSTAQQIGLGETAITGQLMFNSGAGGLGFGLNKDLAQQAIASIANQGFAPAGATGGGDMGAIASGLYGPVLNQTPGLNPQELAALTPALRYSGTSVAALTDELGNLGAEARAARQPVNEFTSAVNESAAALQAMGSGPGSAGAGVAMGQLGLPPQLVSTLASNPLFQGLSLSQGGVFPSALGQESPGAFTGTMMSEIQMMQRASSGLNRNVWRLPNGTTRVGGTTPPVPGAYLELSGQSQQDSWIAQQTGIPFNIIQDYTQHRRMFNAGTDIQAAIGSRASGTGLAGYFNNAHPTAAQQTQEREIWTQSIQPHLRALGLSTQQINQLDAQRSLKTRVAMLTGTEGHHAMSGILSELFKNKGGGAIKGGNAVTLDLTPAAKQLVRQLPGNNSGPSANKRAANAGVPVNGQDGSNSYMTNALGDISHRPTVPIDPNYAHVGW